MKSIKHEIVYEGATVDQVVEMLGQVAFREAVCDYQHVVRREVTITPAGAGKKVVLDQYHAADQVPSFAKKFIGDEIQVLQEENWSSPTDADIKVTIPGKPGEMKGTARIAQVGDKVVETVKLDVKVGIPLVGGKLEGLIADLLTKALKAENKTGIKWLAGDLP